MLNAKIMFIFRTRGVREFLLLAVEFSSQNCYWLLHAYLTSEKHCGHDRSGEDWWAMYISVTRYVIF